MNTETHFFVTTYVYMCILPHTFQLSVLYKANILSLIILAKETVWILQVLFIFWHNCSAIAELQQHEKARGQFAQTRNRLQKASLPAIHPAIHPAGRVL